MFATHRTSVKQLLLSTLCLEICIRMPLLDRGNGQKQIYTNKTLFGADENTCLDETSGKPVEYQ